MNNLLIGLLVVQIGAAGYFLVGKKAAALNSDQVNMQVAVIVPEIDEEVVSITVPGLPEEEVDPFDFDIPDRRNLDGRRTINLDKNVNVMERMGEAMMDNPVFLRGIEKAIRKQFAEFYADFVKEANLTPEEQIELFKIMSAAMQENIRSMMSAMGENMEKMEEMFSSGPPAELIEGIKENNLQLKDGFIATLGQERFELFEQYHIEKSAAESFTRMKNRLNRRKVPLTADQEEQMRQVMLEEQRSPFREESYENTKNHPSEKTGGILNEQQQKVFEGTRQKHNRLLLLPF